MAELGVALLTFADAELRDLVSLARDAEDLGYRTCYTTESLTDVFAIDLAMLLQTSTIRVGSFVAVAPMRHPVITAQAAVTLSELSGGRFVLGLGLGHKVRVQALGMPVGRPTEDLAAYLRTVKDLLRGDVRRAFPDLPPQVYQGKVLDVRTPSKDVPVYAAAVGPKMARVGAEMADGLMVYLVPQRGLAELVAIAGGAVPVDFAVHAFVTEDLERARDQARRSLSYWVGMNAYNDALARAGYEREAAQLLAAFKSGDHDGVRAGITDDLIDAYCLVGPAGRCREQLDAWAETGVTTLAVMPDPISPDEPYVHAVRRTLAELAPR